MPGTDNNRALPGWGVNIRPRFKTEFCVELDHVDPPTHQAPLLGVGRPAATDRPSGDGAPHADARVVQTLLNAGRIAQLPVPITPVDTFINAYPKLGTDKGKGERDTIRLGVATPRVIMDDQQAFFAAARFELNPLTLLDLIVELTRSRKLSKEMALKITKATSGRYATVSIEHTVYKVNEVSDDPDHH